MKTHILLIAILLLCQSCEKPKKDIIGKWIKIQEIIYINDKLESDTHYDPLDSLFYEILIVNEDHTNNYIKGEFGYVHVKETSQITETKIKYHGTDYRYKYKNGELQLVSKEESFDPYELVNTTKIFISYNGPNPPFE